MKRVFIFLSILLISSIVFISSVKAANGPDTTNGIIKFYKDSDNLLVYDSGTINNNAVSGAAYDSESNTLTIKDIKNKYALDVECMGEDFKIKVLGENELSLIEVTGHGYKTNITFTGDGILTVNTNGSDEDPIPIYSYSDSKFIFEDTVSLYLYATESVDDFDDYFPIVIDSDYASSNDESSMIIFKGSNTPEVKVERVVSSVVTQSEYGFGIVPESFELLKIATKDDKKYAYELVSGGTIKVYLSELVEDPYSHKWFIDDSDTENGSDTLEYANAEAAGADYNLTPDNAYRGFYRFKYWIFKDSSDKRYYWNSDAKYTDVDSNGIVYEATDKTITLKNGREYTYLEYKDININTLTPIKDITYDDTYTHYVKGKELVINRRKEEKKESKNPKTNDNIITFISILLISSYIIIKRKA